MVTGSTRDHPARDLAHSCSDEERPTGRARQPIAPFTEAALVVGRRGGKSRILALIAVYLACDPFVRPRRAALGQDRNDGPRRGGGFSVSLHFGMQGRLERHDPYRGRAERRRLGLLHGRSRMRRRQGREFWRASRRWLTLGKNSRPNPQTVKHTRVRRSANDDGNDIILGMPAPTAPYPHSGA